MSHSTSTRARRGCVLLVGHELMTEELTRACCQTPRSATNLFEAMGELTTAHARNPVAAALISETLLVRGGSGAIEALRRVDPSVRLIQVSPNGKAAAESSLFDATVRWPATVRELAEAVGDDLIDLDAARDEDLIDTASAPGEEVRTPPSDRVMRGSMTEARLDAAARGPSKRDPDHDSGVTAARLEPVSEQREQESSRCPAAGPPPVEPPQQRVISWPGAPSTDERGIRTEDAREPLRHAPAPPVEDPPWRVEDPPLPTSSTPAWAEDRPDPDAGLSLKELTSDRGEERTSCPPGGGRALSEDLGDIDLVGSVVHDARGVRDTAISLMRQQTGWDDVQLIGERDHVPDGAVCVDVKRDACTYGRLISTEAGAPQLRAWAQWLSHWLMLDEAYRSYRLLTYRDELTGAWNRRYFHRFMKELIAEARERRRQVTVMVFDVDEFKRFNDEFSHQAGDVILCETVSLLNSVIRRCDRVCRIGGDEFAVVFADLEAPREAGSSHPGSVELIARRFQEQICHMRFPKLGLEAPGNLSISAGLATYPWDGSDPWELLRLADERALESKRKGKNHITFGPRAAEECEEG